MFGIGKKKEGEKEVVKEAEKGTADEIQFDFEEDDKLPFDDEEGFTDEYAAEDEPPRKGLRQALSQRTLLLGLLLLLVLGGGGYYYLSGTSAPPPPKPAAPVKKKVAAQPVKPATPAPKTALAPAAAGKPATVPVKSEQPAPATKESPVAAAKPVPAVKTSTPAVAVPAPAEAKNEVVAPPAPAIRQPFTLSVGAFLSPKHQREVEKKIRRLGYTPKVQTTYTSVPMTRLLLGVYDPATAQARSRELSTLVPDLFSLKQGAQVALYAGSYQSLDQARSFADQLYLRGIHVDEEAVSLRMPLKKVSFGSFASRAAAEKAAKRAIAAGLTAQVVKR